MPQILRMLLLHRAGVVVSFLVRVPAQSWLLAMKASTVVEILGGLRCAQSSRASVDETVRHLGERISTLQI
jgi:hypothetical protein